MEDGCKEYISSMKLVQSPRRWLFQTIKKWCTQYSLVHNDTHSIVDQALAKYDGVELGINLILVENGQNGDGIRGRQGRAKN